jgi:hypothetical protein
MYPTAMSRGFFPRVVLLILLIVAPLNTVFPGPHGAIEAAGVSDVYGDATGLFDQPLEWASVGLGLVDAHGRDVFLTFHAGPVMMASIEFRQPLTSPQRPLRLQLIPRAGLDIQLDEAHGGDVYIGASLSTELHPSSDLGYYLFIRVDGWLNTFGGNVSKDVVYLTVPIGIGFTVPFRTGAVH